MKAKLEAGGGVCIVCDDPGAFDDVSMSDLGERSQFFRFIRVTPCLRPTLLSTNLSSQSSR